MFSCAEWRTEEKQKNCLCDVELKYGGVMDEFFFLVI
jgi:hypothetical protein